MKKNRLMLVLAVLLLAACGGNSNVEDRLRKSVDISLFPCSSGGWQGSKYSEPRYYYVDYDGNPVVESGDYNLAPFASGLAYVREKGGRRFFMDKNGEPVIELNTFNGSGRAYSVFDRFTDGIAFVKADSIDEQQGRVYPRCYAINPKGEILFMVDGKPETPMESGFCLVRNENGNFVINRKGEVVVDASKESGLRIIGLCGSRRDMAIAFVDNEYAGLLELASGNYLIPEIPLKEIEYCSTVGFDWNDRAIVRRDGRYGLIDRKGKTIVEPEYDNLVIDGKWYMADNDGLATWIDADGKVMLESDYKFNKERGFGTGDLCCVDDGIYIDRKGRVKLECEYSAKTPFINGRAIVYVPVGKGSYAYAWMDETGVISEQYFPASEGFIVNVARMAKGLYVAPTTDNGY